MATGEANPRKYREMSVDFDLTCLGGLGFGDARTATMPTRIRQPKAIGPVAPRNRVAVCHNSSVSRIVFPDALTDLQCSRVQVMSLLMTEAVPPSGCFPSLDEVLTRLASCEGLVHEELQRYQSLECAAETGAQQGGQAEQSTPVLTSIVVPVYNEERTIARVLSRLAALPFAKELIVVDDCSRDGTREILQKLEGLPGFKLVLKPVNEGKGAALRTGFEQAAGDLIVVQDADLEYDPADLPAVLGPLLRNEADVVFGSRFIGAEVQDKSVVHRFGNWVLTTASNLFTGVRLTDMETCYKAFRREILKDLKLKQNRFGVEPEMTAKLARLGYRLVEVPVTYQARGYKDGKKIGVRDLFKAVYCIVRYGVAD